MMTSIRGHFPWALTAMTPLPFPTQLLSKHTILNYAEASSPSAAPVMAPTRSSFAAHSHVAAPTRAGLPFNGNGVG